MIIYFTDRQMNVIGSASTSLPKGLSIIYDNKTEDIDTGVAIFECDVAFDNENERLCESCCEVGNYILRKNDDENEFYTIIDFEKDSKKQKIYVYAEDAGLDLLNEIVGAYEADKAYSLEYYVNKFSYDSGFEIGINEAVGLTRKLSWDGEATAAERIRSLATQFDNCEISYSFDIENLQITHKYINIYKKRGKDEGIQLRLNKEIDRIITKKSIKNLATALEVTGGTPEDAENPITLKGYTYDDGDFYVSGSRLYSREALKKWSRYVWTNEPNKSNDLGHIVRSYSYDTTSQKELCTRSISELKKLCEIEVNYEVDISTLPDNVKIGDTVNIIDDRGELYLQARLLKLEHSITDMEHKATLGDFLIKEDGISQTVKDLASQFALETQSAKNALEIAKAANAQAQEAKTQADSALTEANSASEVASAAQEVASQATASAQEATTKADAANTAIAAWCYNNNTTYIDGAKIYTGTITANQIASNAITAEKLNVTSLSAISSNLGSVTAGSININDRFIVDGGGNLTSKSGYIAGWQINQTNLTSPTKTSGTMQSVSQINPYGFYNERYDSSFNVANLYTIEINDGEISFWEKTRKSDGDYVLNQLQIMGRNINNVIYNGTTTIGNEESLVTMQSIIFNDDGGIDISAPDGEITMNGMRFGAKILATTALYMKADQSISLSDKVSNQVNGIILAWSYYISGEGGKNYNWNFFFIPKHHVQLNNGGGIDCFNAMRGMRKYVYVYDDKIKGHTNNNTSGNQNGIEYANKNYVLRYVIGV